MKRFLTAFVLMCSVFTTAVQASWQEASVEVEQTVKDLVAVIDRYRDQDPLPETAVEADIEAIVDRDVDVEYIANWVMGKYYRQATAAQRKEFAKVFKQTLIKTYSKSLLSFNINSYQLVPATAESPEADKQIVSVDVTSKAGETYTLVNYIVLKKGEWKLVNVMLNGINLRITFKNQFADMMQRNRNDVAAVIASWSAHIDNQPASAKQ